MKGFFPAIDANAAVFVSDTLVDHQLRQQLMTAAATLEAVPDAQKDWHPGSGNKVLDLVHPSLYSLVYGRSRVLEDKKVPRRGAALHTGKGLQTLAPQIMHDESGVWDIKSEVLYSRNFQWLPCDIAFRPKNGVEITSYINNLQPERHEGLYGTIEQVISKVLPMWDATLRETVKRSPTKNSFTRYGYNPARIRYGLPKWRHVDGWKRSGLVMPEPSKETYKARKTCLAKAPMIDLRKEHAEHGIQVIVKLANIHLTPDSPAYEGSGWHIEGQLNEHICASALYYYDSENITDSYLAFRERINGNELEIGEDRGYQPDEYEHVQQLLGVEHDFPNLQELGRIRTKEGRLITFPNVLHHRVEPFELRDKTKPGHRKILALFLVDPYIRIPSTANVPPQQADWWRDAIQELNRVGDLPPELVDHIVEQAEDCVMDLDEAKELRVEVMAGRTALSGAADEALGEHYVSFCQH